MSAIPSLHKQERLDTPEAVIMRNLLRMMWEGRMTTEEANQFLDELPGFDPAARFWGAKLEPQGEKGRIRNLMWKNGGWVEGKTRDEEVMEIIREGQKR